MRAFFSDVEGFGGDSFLWFTKLFVEVWNVQNGQRKTMCNNVQKHYKWGEEAKLKYDVQILNEQIVQK
jgi:hypothetical protein